MHIASGRAGAIINTAEVYREQYFVGTTSSSLLLADLHAGLHSEIAWTYTGTERFLFDTPQVWGFNKYVGWLYDDSQIQSSLAARYESL